MPMKQFSSKEGYKLYRHTSPSGKVYIGITKTSVYARWNKGRGYRRNQPAFYNAILKYGWDNINHEILFDNLTKDRAERLEIELIRHYKGLKLSYNIADGGGLTNQSEYSRRRSSETMKRLWREIPHILLHRETNKGKKKSIESIRLRSNPVIQFDRDGKPIQEFLSVTEASMSTGISNRSITNCCKGGCFCKCRNRFINIKQAGGYIWKYREEIICQ